MTDPTTPAPADPALPVGARVGVFEIRRVLARSAATTVYLATDHALEMDVALQEYLPSRFVGRDAEQVLHALDPQQDAKLARGMQVFIDEARMLARCDHPSLVRVANLFEANQTVYSVMPHYAGQRLSDLRRDIDAPPDEASLRALLDSLLGALDAIHRSGQVHGGVTAANILVLGDDRPLLLGPGAVDRVIGSDLVESLMATLESAFEPSAGAAASASAPPSGAAADLHALAQVMRFCILGGPAAAAAPHARESLAESIVESFAPEDRPRYSAALLSALDAAVSPVVDDRPVSVAQWRDWLDHAAPRRRRPTEPPAAAVAAPRGADPAQVAAARPVPAPGPAPASTPTPEPVDHRRGQAGADRGVDVEPVRALPRDGVAAQSTRQRDQRVVFRGGRRRGHARARGACGRAHVGNHRLQVDRGHAGLSQKRPDRRTGCRVNRPRRWCAGARTAGAATSAPTGTEAACSGTARTPSWARTPRAGWPIPRRRRPPGRWPGVPASPAPARVGRAWWR
ncbi:MAG: hypothetical protein ABIQ60_17075 [Burkholderiaceae bacterium]